MRLNNYLANSYIGIVSKDEEREVRVNNREVNILLKELNNYLRECCNENNYKFSLTENYQSPSEILDLNDKSKEEKVIRWWMRASEYFEEIKESHINSLQNE